MGKYNDGCENSSHYERYSVDEEERFQEREDNR
jgi:hypothetical protein